MKELVKAEFRKIFSRKSIWVFIGVALLLELFAIHSTGQLRNEKNLQINGYQGFEGTYNPERWEAVENSLKQPNSLHPLSIKDEIERLELKNDFPNFLNSRIIEISNNMQKIEDVNSFQYRSYAKYKAMLSKIDMPQIYMDRGWIISVDTLSRDFFVILVLLFGVCTIFSNEYSLGTDSLILTSTYGKNRIILAKFITQ